MEEGLKKPHLVVTTTNLLAKNLFLYIYTYMRECKRMVDPNLKLNLVATNAQALCCNQCSIPITYKAIPICGGRGALKRDLQMSIKNI